MDNFSKEQRSYIMRQVKSKDTEPEILVRSLAHRLGYRFRLHRKDLPGSPDIVFVSRRKVIFIHGCFWHGHNCPHGKRKPKSNHEYWKRKISGNKSRDRSNRRKLRKLGWESLVIWECQLKDPEKLKKKLISFLDDPPKYNQ